MDRTSYVPKLKVGTRNSVRPKRALDVDSDAGGFGLPAFTSVERDALWPVVEYPNYDWVPVMIYNTTEVAVQYFTGTGWATFSANQIAGLFSSVYGNFANDDQYRAVHGVGGGPYTNGFCTTFIEANSDYVNFGDITTFNAVTELTISTWFNPIDLNSIEYLWSKYRNTTNKTQLVYSSGPDELLILFDSASATLAGPFVAGIWYHIVLVYDGTQVADADKVKLYINGVLQVLSFTGSMPATLYDGAGDNLIVGTRGDLVPASYMDAKIDELSIWDDHLTAADITAMYNSGEPNDLTTHAKVANLANWWHMGDGDAHPVIFDDVGTDDGTMVNMSSANFTPDGIPAGLGAPTEGNSVYWNTTIEMLKYYEDGQWWTADWLDKKLRYFEETTEPATPGAGYLVQWAENGRFYTKDDTGRVNILETPMNVVDLFDNNTEAGASINGSAGATLSVVAVLAADVRRIQIFDTVGKVLGWYDGADTLLFISGPGTNEMTDIELAAGTELKVRSMETDGGTAGLLMANLLG